MVQNKAVIFKAVPHGFPVAGKDLVIETRSIDLDASLPPNTIQLKNFYFSFDPAQRGRMRDPNQKSYSAAYTLGQPIANVGISRVLKSTCSHFEAGDIVIGRLGFEEYTLITDPVIAGNNVLTGVRKLQNPYGLPLTEFLGALGGPGITAYGSLYEIGKPKKGETMFVSAASGAVGQIVGQLGKMEGMRVIGSVGSDEKLELIKGELGFDDGFNYKKEDLNEAMARLMPEGIDVYFDNVGGEMLDLVLLHTNNFGRIVACGAISGYNVKSGEGYRLANTSLIVMKRILMQGFVRFDDNIAKYHDEHQERVGKWIKEGKMKTVEDITHGIDNAVEGFLGMLQGRNFGKAALKVAEVD